MKTYWFIEYSELSGAWNNFAFLYPLTFQTLSDDKPVVPFPCIKNVHP